MTGDWWLVLLVLGRSRRAVARVARAGGDDDAWRGGNGTRGHHGRRAGVNNEVDPLVVGFATASAVGGRGVVRVAVGATAEILCRWHHCHRRLIDPDYGMLAGATMLL